MVDKNKKIINKYSLFYFKYIKRGGFTLAEMMILLLVISIITAAYLPVITSRTKMNTTTSTAGLWKLASNNLDVYYGTGATQGVLSGSNSFAEGEKAKYSVNIPDSSYIHGLLKQAGTIKGNFSAYNNSLSLSNLTLSNATLGCTAIGIAAAGYPLVITNNYSTAVGSGAQSGDYSVAYGSTAKATGAYSCAIGNSAQAAGLGTLSFGAGTANGNYSIIFCPYGGSVDYTTPSEGSIYVGAMSTYGYPTKVGYRSIGIGNGSRALGSYCTALGNAAYAGQTSSLTDYAIAIGSSYNGGASVYAIGGTAIGSGAAASDYAVAIGSLGSDYYGSRSGASYSTSYGVAIGSKANSAGTGSVAIGYQAKTSGDDATYSSNNNYSIAIGSNAIVGTYPASSSYNIAIGKSATSKNGGSIAIGAAAHAYGADNIAIGDSAATSASAYAGSIAIGNGGSNGTNSLGITVTGSGASQDEGCAFGYSTGAAMYACSFGYAAAANYNGVSIGSYSRAGNMSTTALGYYAQATNTYAVAIGGYNSSYSPAYAQASGVGSIALGTACQASGNYSLAIGTNVKVSGANSTCISTSTAAPQVSASNSTYIGGSGTNESVNIPGTLWLNALQITSDAKLKNIIGKYKGGLKEIKQINSYNYTLKRDKNKTPMVGVIAQELKKIFPNSVYKSPDGYYAINRDEILYAMLNSIKELNNIIKALFSDIQIITSKLEVIENKINDFTMFNKNDNEKIIALEKKSKVIKLETKKLKMRLQ